MGKVKEQNTKDKGLTKIPPRGPYWGYRSQKYYN